MDVDVLIFIEIRRDAVLFRNGADIADGDLGRFRHDLAQLAGDLDFPGTGQDDGFDVHGFAANGSPGQAGDQPHLIGGTQAFVQIFPSP